MTFLGADVEHKVDIAGLIRARASGPGAPALPPGTRVAVEIPAPASAGRD